MLAERFNDVVVLHADIVGFSALTTNHHTHDCILALNRIFSMFDTLMDTHKVHKVRGARSGWEVAMGGWHGWLTVG